MVHEGNATKAAKPCMAEGCCRAGDRRGMCQAHYKRWQRAQPSCSMPGCTATLVPDDRKTRGDYCRQHEQLALTKRTKAGQAKTLERFRRGIEPDPLYGCWLWQEATPEDGYGRIHAGSGTWLAHRFSYVWFFGGHARRKTLDHLCNQILCVRPDHLEPLSNTENVKRRSQRQNAASGTAWKHEQMPYPPAGIEAMNVWARENDLPYGNPEWLEERVRAITNEELLVATIPALPAGAVVQNDPSSNPAMRV